MRDNQPGTLVAERPKRRDEVQGFRFEYVRIEHGSRPLPWSEQAQWVPAVDIYGNETQLVVEIHLPGVAPEATQLELGQNYLRVSGFRRDAEIAGRREYYHMEIERGRFQRLIHLPEGVSSTDYETVFDLGVLRITFPYQNKALGAARSAGRFPEELA